MRLNSKGQVTIPADLRERYGLREGDEVEVHGDEDGLRIVPVQRGDNTRGSRAAARLRGTATTKLSTDQIMALLRDE